MDHRLFTPLLTGRTQNGYIHVSLRQLSASEDVNDTVKIELCVSDTGKGISQNFLKVSSFVSKIEFYNSYIIIRTTYFIRSHKRILYKLERAWDLQS